jgi:hypothetical protein
LLTSLSASPYKETPLVTLVTLVRHVYIISMQKCPDGFTRNG